MIKQFYRASVTIWMLAFLTSISFAQTEQRIRELPNFHKINDQLYRGAQPATGGMKKLSALGIKTVVNLRGEDENTRAEEKEAMAAGLRYFSVAMPGLSRPQEEQVTRVLEIISAPENGPVFIHCKHGADRTGTIIAVYRITRENWTADRAITEAKQYGMSWVQFGMKSYISDYFRRNQKAASVRVTADATP
jgi:protein tyrosine/serine phosphatase